MKNAKKSKKSENQVVTNNNENVNWNAKYYREKNAAFYSTASYSGSSRAKTKTITPIEITLGLKAASKVRHNPVKPQATISSIVMVAGVPHKMRDGKLVPMIPASESKKWDIIEA